MIIFNGIKIFTKFSLRLVRAWLIVPAGSRLGAHWHNGGPRCCNAAQPITARAACLRPLRPAFCEPPAAFSLLLPRRMSLAPSRPLYLLLRRRSTCNKWLLFSNPRSRHAAIQKKSQSFCQWPHPLLACLPFGLRSQNPSTRTQLALSPKLLETSSRLPPAIASSSNRVC